MKTRADVEYAREQARLSHSEARNESEKKFFAGQISFCDWFLSEQENQLCGRLNARTIDDLSALDCRG